MTQDDPTPLATQARQICELQDLVTLMLKDLPCVNPWARQHAAHLSGADRQIQVLGMTVSLKRSTDEIRQAAENVVASCRLSRAALAGSRVDNTTLAALILVITLAERVRGALASLPREVLTLPTETSHQNNCSGFTGPDRALTLSRKAVTPMSTRSIKTIEHQLGESDGSTVWT